MKANIISVVVVIIIIVGAFVLPKGNKQDAVPDVVENVTVENGLQIITIDVKAGYSPKKSIAKAGIPTVIRLNTNGTFDCSSSIRIPSLGINQILPQTGATDIDAGTQQVSVLNGTCGMGMYSFEINFV